MSTDQLVADLRGAIEDSIAADRTGFERVFSMNITGPAARAFEALAAQRQRERGGTYSPQVQVTRVPAIVVKVRKKRGDGAASIRKDRIIWRTSEVLKLLGVKTMPDGVEVVPPGMPNKTEMKYLSMLCAMKMVGEIAAYDFAPVRLRVGVGACKYKPDILIRHNDGSIEVIECKMWRWANGISKVKTAAMLFPQWRFRIASLVNGTWEYEELSDTKGKP
jgi:hypothetical protein